MAPNPSALAGAARVSPDFVHIVSQAMGDGPTLRGDVAEQLADDAEYYLRDLIHRAKGYMRHSKSRRLSTAHIARAEREQKGGRPILGFSSRRPLSFERVPGSDGLFVTHDPVVALVDVFTQPLPPQNPPVDVAPAWRFLRGGDGTVILDDGPDHTLDPDDVSLPKRAPRSLQPLAAAVQTCLSTRPGAAAALEPTLRRVTQARSVPYQRIAQALRTAVHKHARVGGQDRVLGAAMRVVRALAARREVQLGAWADALIPAVLTVVAGRNATGRATRETAVAALGDVSRVDGVGKLARARAAGTLVRVMLDAGTDLSALHGAIAGLAVLGRECFETAVMPQVCALMRGLDRALEAGREVGGTADVKVVDEVAAVCEAIERGTRMWGLVEDVGEIDVLL